MTVASPSKSSETTESGEMITQLSKLLRVAPASLLPGCLYMVGVALGNAAKLVTPIFPGPLNFALGCVVCEGEQGPFGRAIDFLSQPIQATQDARLNGLGERARRILEDELAKMEAQAAKAALHNGGPDNKPIDGAAQVATLRRLARPLLWVQDPRPNHLSRILSASFDQAAGLFFHDGALNKLLDTTGLEANNAWTVLRDGFFGRSSLGLCFDPKPGPPVVRPMVAPFMIGAPETLARLFAIEDSVASQVVAQCVLLPSSLEDSDQQTDPDLVAASSNRWAEFLGDLLKLRESGRELVVEFSPQATRVLMEFWLRHLTPQPSLSLHQRRFAQNTAVIAAKLAGSFQVLSANYLAPVSDVVMTKAIRMAEHLSADTAESADTLRRRQREAELAETVDKMFDFLGEMGRTKRWPLWKRFDRHPKKLMQAALDILVRSGRARSFADGSVEAIVEKVVAQDTATELNKGGA